MDTLSLFDIHKICRICLKSDLLVSIYSPTFLVRPIEMIEKLNIFKNAFDDGLPTLICQPCLYRLLDAYNLQQLSEASENRLREYLMNLSGIGNCSLDLSTGVTTPNKITNGSSCFSSSPINSPQRVENADSVGIYENIYHIFDKSASNDIEVEDDVLNDVVIDVSSLTRSEAEENTVSDVAVNTSAVEQDIFDVSKNNQIKQQIDEEIATACIEKLPQNKIAVLKTPYKCLECGKAFTYSGYLEIHMRTHTGEKPFLCEICQKSFTQSGNLMQHMRTHSRQRQFQCEKCSHFFTTSSNLKAHSMTHKERRDFSCSQCTRLFKSKCDLKKHESIHKATKDIICGICCKSFSRSSYLSAHMSAVHRNNRKHKCSECNKSFGSRSNLVCHLRIHNGEKPFHCKYCTWKFSQSSALTRHMKKHFGERRKNSIPENCNGELIINCLQNAKIKNLPDDLISSTKPPLLDPQSELPNISGLSQLNTQLMDASEGDFTFSGTPALPAYDFTKENILDFSSSQQTLQPESVVY